MYTIIRLKLQLVQALDSINIRNTHHMKSVFKNSRLVTDIEIHLMRVRKRKTNIQRAHQVVQLTLAVKDEVEALRFSALMSDDSAVIEGCVGYSATQLGVHVGGKQDHQFGQRTKVE